MEFEPIDRWDPPSEPRFVDDFAPPRMFSRFGSFVWWWWMFFFEERGVKKQIIFFWTTKNYGCVRVNGVRWAPPAKLRGTESAYRYKGMSTGWFWDGARVQKYRPIISEILTQRTQRTQRSADAVRIAGADFSLRADGERFALRFARPDQRFALRVERLAPHPPPVKYKRTLLTKVLGFDTLKIYYVNWEGRLVGGGEERPVRGSLYMQNICLNAPALPWLWGVFHNRDGSYFTYMTSFFGPSLLTRSVRGAARWDNRFLCVNKNFNYTPAGEPTKRLKDVHYRVIRERGELPQFELSGALGGERVRVRLRTLARSTYRFERQKLWRNRFFYNEFPAEVVLLQRTDADGRVTRDDPADWTGNCEYSWGLLLN